MSGLGIGGGSGSGGKHLALSLKTIAAGVTANVSRLHANLKGTVTYSKLSGSSNVTINATTGQISLGTALSAGGSNSFVARAANATGDAIEAPFTLTGAGAAPAAPSFDFSIAANSQYAPLIAA